MLPFYILFHTTIIMLCLFVTYAFSVWMFGCTQWHSWFLRFPSMLSSFMWITSILPTYYFTIFVLVMPWSYIILHIFLSRFFASIVLAYNFFWFIFPICLHRCNVNILCFISIIIYMQDQLLGPTFDMYASCLTTVCFDQLCAAPSGPRCADDTSLYGVTWCMH